MTEGDVVRLWEQLRGADEDIIQDTIVALLALSQPPTNPLAWCRAVAHRIRCRRYRDERPDTYVEIPRSLGTASLQEQRAIAKEVLDHADIDVLRVGFGAPGRLPSQRRSERRAHLKSL